MTVRYLYLRPDLKRNDLGAVCFGYYFNDNQIVYASSICSPKDNFSRKMAHDIIGGRLIKTCKTIPYESEKEPKYADAIRLIKEDYLKTTEKTFEWVYDLLNTI